MDALLLERRPPPIQAPNKTGKGNGERQKERHIEPIPFEQHLETGGMEMTILLLEIRNKKTSKQ